MLILAMDANFRLKNKLRGLLTDPSLSPGWAYFVDHIPYAKFVAEAAADEDVSRPSSASFVIIELTIVLDRKLRWVPSAPQYVNKVVKGTTRNWNGCGQLCAPPVV